MPNGTQITLIREVPVLAENAAPLIFPKCSKYLTKKLPKPRNPRARYTGSPHKRSENKILQDLIEERNHELVTPPLPQSPPPTEPEQLVKNIKAKLSSPADNLSANLREEIHQFPQRIPLPNKMWAVFQDKDATTFAHMSKHHKTIGQELIILDTRNAFYTMKTFPRKRKGASIVIGKERATLKKIRRLENMKLKRQRSRKKDSKIRRQSITIARLNQEIKDCHSKMRNLKEEAIKEILDKLPEKQRLAVETIIMASKVEKTQNRRYKYAWLYECMLLRIKSGKLYRKMLRDNFLPLPSLRTLQRYIRKLKPAFGFHEPTFKVMEKKKEHLTEAQRHGALLIDEMALDEGVHFDKETLEVLGFVMLGSASPENSSVTLGDHALVFIFQPFQGQWFQAIGAYCSRGACRGPELEKLTTEAILLLEKHGYFVDEVTTDGGSWNRNMWTLFGISEESVSCRHPTALEEDPEENDDVNDEENLDDPSHKPKQRRLYFCSDFPHLIKSIWSRVRSSEILQTPDGKVKLDHWKSVVKHDSSLLKHINNCWKLTEDHITPTTYQAMNVQMAFQFFSEDVALAMEHYRDKMQVSELHDCHATVSFIRVVNKLIHAMNAKDTWDSLTDDNDNKSKQAIQEFIDFLTKWKAGVSQEHLRLAWQTHLGLMVTLKGALELVKYLTEDVGYRYLMTRKLNQDALEVFRLLQTASLIKPPRGSNVTGGQMLESITTLQEVIEETAIEKKIKLEEILDNLLDNGEADEILQNNFLPVNDHDHSYHFNCTIDKYAFEMFGGYVARKARTFSVAKKCDSCFNSLLRPNDQPLKESQYLIEKRSRGHLLVPSDSLTELLYQVESILLVVFSRSKMNRHILLDVLDAVKDVKLKRLVGCEQHQSDLSKAILRFYLTTRMHFACRRYMKQVNATNSKKKKKRAKALLKLHRLNATLAGENGVPEENVSPKPSKKSRKRKSDQETVAFSNVVEESVWDDMGINWADIPDGPTVTTGPTAGAQDDISSPKKRKRNNKPEPSKPPKQPKTKVPTHRKQNEKKQEKQVEEVVATRRSNRARKVPIWQETFTTSY
ncbi:Transposable element P transposase [Frankliniella fusca]|uniref:Transposable element P transposase n=1 Tax=Frankliniella fusca TaxID=407009 RepID=A0AAE1LDW2_9NEOP|nr:Transposable element P transposase [Frankliniella fusca]